MSSPATPADPFLAPSPAFAAWACSFCGAPADRCHQGLSGENGLIIYDRCVDDCARKLGFALVPLNEVPVIEVGRRMVIRDLDHFIEIATRARQELAGT